MANRIEFETYVNPAGFKAGLTAMEASADATNMRLQNRIRSRIAGAEGRMAAAAPNSWEYVQAAQRKATLEKQLLTVQNAMHLRNANARNAIQQTEVAATKTAEAEKIAANRAALDSITLAEREQAIVESQLMDESIAKAKAAELAKVEANRAAWIAGQAEWRKIQEAQTATMLANFEVQRVANAKLVAEQLAANLTIARGYGAGGGGSTAGHGGFAGIIRESLVIVRELSMGRGMGRVAGSVTLLAQYLGLLGKVVHSTASEAVMASDAATKLSQAMNLAALKAKGTAEYEMLNAAAMKQEAAAAESATQKEIALLNAKVRLNAIGWGAIGIGVAVIALISLWRYYSKITEAAEKFRRSTDISTNIENHHAESIQREIEARRELDRWLQKELSDRKDLASLAEEQMKQLHEQAAAEKELMRSRSASATEINAMDVKELQTEKAMTEAILVRASADVESARARLESLNANRPDSSPMMSAQDALTAASKAATAIRESVADNPIVQDLIRQKNAGETFFHGALGVGAELKYPFQSRAIKQTRTSLEEQAFSGKDVSIDDAIKAFREAAGESDSFVKFGSTLKQAESAEMEAMKAVERLKNAQDDYADEIEKTKGDLASARETQLKYKQRVKEIVDDLSIKTGLGAQAAAAEDAKKGNKLITSDSMVKVGNFLGTARSGIESLAAKQLEVAKQSLHHLKSMDNKMGGNGTSFSGS